MSGQVMHFLTETDSFSDLEGAALQRWVANVVRFERVPCAVACARADKSWDLDHVEVIRLRALRRYRQVRGRYRLPWKLRMRVLRSVLRPAVAKLKAGDVAWIHNRPDYAAAIQQDVRSRGAKLVVHFHNTSPVPAPASLFKILSPDRIVFCSEYLQREVARLHPQLDLSRCSVLYNGADERRFFPRTFHPEPSAERRVPVTLFAGRLVPEKGAHVLLEAARLLNARGVAAKLRVLGATGFGPENRPTQYLRSLRETAPPNAQFVGYRNGMALAEEFRSADIFCSPAVWDEPFGLVNVEAMASGVPVIASNGGGAPEIFANGGGLLVDRDDPARLAHGLEKLLLDKHLRQDIGRAGYQSFRERFTWSVVHSRYREVLSKIEQESINCCQTKIPIRDPVSSLSEESCHFSL